MSKQTNNTPEDLDAVEVIQRIFDAAFELYARAEGTTIGTNIDAVTLHISKFPYNPEMIELIREQPGDTPISQGHIYSDYNDNLMSDTPSTNLKTQMTAAIVYQLERFKKRLNDDTVTSILSASDGLMRLYKETQRITVVEIDLNNNKILDPDSYSKRADAVEAVQEQTADIANRRSKLRALVPELLEALRHYLTEPQEGTAPGIRTLPRKNIPIPEYIQTGSSKIYHSVQDIIARAALTTENGEPWPTGRILCKDLNAEVQIRPDPATVDYLAADELLGWQKKAADYALSMSDETADVLDYITYEVINQANGPEQDVIFSAERFYQLRGIKKQKAGDGHRGGYKTEYRRDFAREVERLESTWVLVAEMERVTLNEKGKRTKTKQRGMESRAIEISIREGQLNINRRVEADTFRGRLGPLFATAIFGVDPEYALMTKKALGYDPYRQVPEKRLTRYLSWQWRIRQNSGNYLQPFTVETLLKSAGLEIDKRNPDRTKNRLEKAFDTLEHDDVISGWQYGDGWEEEKVGKRGWVETWKAWNVCVEPPPHIPEYYKEKIQAIEPKKQKALSPPKTILLRLQAALTNLTQMQAAENIGINQATLSRIVSGKNASPENRKKILAWLDKQESLRS